MEIRIQRIFLKSLAIVLGIGLLIPFAHAAEPQNEEAEPSLSNIKVFDPQVERREVDKDAIDTENWEFGAYYGVISIEDFGANDIIGANFAYHVTEDLFIAANFAESEADLTSAEILTGISVLPGDRAYTHYDVSLGLNVLPGEGFLGKNIAFTSYFYLSAGLGATDFAGDSHSTAVVGGGYKVLFNDWFAVNVALRDYIYKIEIVGPKTASDLEISTGFTIFF